MLELFQVLTKGLVTIAEGRLSYSFDFTLVEIDIFSSILNTGGGADICENIKYPSWEKKF